MMTSQLPSKERLAKIASWRETYGAGHNVMLPAEEAEIMARALLAAYEQEPYGYVHKDIYERTGSCGLSSDHEAYRNTNGSHIPLYIHPAPSIPAAVPDVCDGLEQEAFEAWASGEHMDMTTHPLHWLFLDEKTSAARQGWKGAITYCRAAMLQAEPVKQQVSLRDGIQSLRDLGGIDDGKVLAERDGLNDDGWIPVRERLPEDRESVLLWDADLDDACSGHYSHETGNFYQAGMIIDNEITHWQPLPAPPKVEDFRENENSSTEDFRENAEASTITPVDKWREEAERMAELHGVSFVVFRNGEEPQCADPTKVVISFTDKGLGHDIKSDSCWCHSCCPLTMHDMRFVVCPDCGNKRCPKANDHRNACSGSNEPGQVGGAYPAAPKGV